MTNNYPVGIFDIVDVPAVFVNRPLVPNDRLHVLKPDQYEANSAIEIYITVPIDTEQT